MSILFKPFQFGPISLQNRFIRSATCSNLADHEGRPTKALIQWYADLAKGGIGMINTGIIKPKLSWNSVNKTLSLTLSDQSRLPAFKKLVERVHEFGTKITAQMSSYFTGDSNNHLAPSPLPDNIKNPKHKSVVAFETDIKNAVKIYGQLAALIREAGFDAVQIHAAHGYGIHQFISPFFNKRTDSYGGSVENRFRIILEIKNEIAKKAGKDFPVWVKLATGDFLEGGMSIEDSIDIAKLLEKAGFIAIEPSCGSLFGNWNSRGPIDNNQWREGYSMEFAEKIKKNVSIPVVVVGGLRKFNLIEDFIKEGKSDLAAMSRAFIREPGLIKRWKNGDLSPSKCISCDECFKKYYLSIKPIRCVFNQEYWDKIEQLLRSC